MGGENRLDSDLFGSLVACKCEASIHKTKRPKRDRSSKHHFVEDGNDEDGDDADDGDDVSMMLLSLL